MNHLRIIARYDSTAFAELSSGVFLMALRGLLLAVAPEAYWPLDVALSLYPIGLNEKTWGAILMLLGSMQILFSGSGHHLIRLTILISIISIFVIVGVSYALSGYLISQTSLSIICIVMFESSLLVRAFHDRADRLDSAR